MKIENLVIKYQEAHTAFDFFYLKSHQEIPAGYFIQSTTSGGMQMTTTHGGPFETKELAQAGIIELIKKEIIEHEKQIEKCQEDIRRMKLKAFW